MPSSLKTNPLNHSHLNAPTMIYPITSPKIVHPSRCVGAPPDQKSNRLVSAAITRWFW
jgi:hypothetical protein